MVELGRFLVRRNTMDRFYKVTVQLYGSPSTVIYTSGRFYSYNIDKFRNEAEAKGLKPASYTPEPLKDPEIMECIKIKEQDYPADFITENLKDYDGE